MPSGKTHFVAGVVTSGVALYYIGGPLEYSFIGGIAALLPDIDHRKSVLGRFTPLHYLLKHRGFTHSYLAVLLLFWGIIFTIENHWIFLVILTGYLSHIWLDWLVGSYGVQLWWPKKRMSSLTRLFK